MRTIQKTLYEFDELSAEAKAKAIEAWRAEGLGYDWWEFSLDAFKDALIAVGFYPDVKIYFSLGYSQSDYLTIEGRYSHTIGAALHVHHEWPQWTELHVLAAELGRIQRRHGYTLWADIGGRARPMVRNWEADTGQTNPEQDLNDVLHSFAQHLYCSLREEYEYLTSDEAISETLRTNGYEFSADGSRY